MANTEFRTKILIRNDIAANWSAINPKLSKGELGIEIDTNLIKIGDGVKTWSELPYFTGDLTNYYTKSEVENLINNIDIPEVDLSGYYTKKEVDDLLETVSIDNIDADKVVFDRDLTFTQTFGKYTPDSTGSVTIPVASENMTLRGLFEAAFSEEKDPDIDTPTVTLTATSNKEAEVGTTFSLPVASLTVTDIGSYQYGPSDTGVRFPIDSMTITQSDDTTHKVSNTTELTKDGAIALTAKNTKGNTYGDTTITYSFNAVSRYKPDATVIPVTNLGKQLPEQRIGYNVTTNEDGTITLAVSGTPKSTTYTGFRKMFWGTMESKPETLTSAQVRALSGLKDSSKANGVKTATGEKSLSIGTGVMRVVVAVPKGRTLSKVLDANDSNANIVGSFSSMEVQVEGNNNYEATTYTVYYIDYANATTVTNTYKVTIA